jgi:myosin heavy subunit
MFKLFASGVDDLVLVSSPSNGEITAQIGARFDRELIYTAIGDVLIAVSFPPFYSCTPYSFMRQG